MGNGMNFNKEDGSTILVQPQRKIDTSAILVLIRGIITHFGQMNEYHE